MKTVTTFKMLIQQVPKDANAERRAPWWEDVPKSLDRRGAPDIAGMKPITRAQMTVDWYNSTQPEGAPHRALLQVIQIRETSLFEATI